MIPRSAAKGSMTWVVAVDERLGWLPGYGSGSLSLIVAVFETDPSLSAVTTMFAVSSDVLPTATSPKSQVTVPDEFVQFDEVPAARRWP